MSTDTTPPAVPDGRPDDAPAEAPGDLPDAVEGRAATTGARPLTAALLNLSGLGLGYLHLRAWARLVAALAATAGLAWLALPIGREPIDVWWAVGYGGALALFALDAAYVARRRARREAPPRTVWAPRVARRVAWATLAVVPLLGAGYVVTQHEVLEQHLAYDLAEAEADLRSAGTVFPPYERLYDAAYTTYQRTATEHPGTRAAERVPSLVDALYEQAKGDDVCNAVAAVRHFAQAGSAGPLRSTAQEELPGVLHDCGLRSTERGVFASARPMLDELLADHPDSGPAQELPRELTAWRDDQIAGLKQFGGCADTRRATESTSYLAGFDSATISALADKARTQIPAGLLACGVRQFEGEQYAAAQTNLGALVESYPRAKDAGYAERIGIAAGMALVEPDAGVKLPARDEPAGTITLTLYNYSPDPFEMVYTGSATGVVTLDSCADCTYYAEGDSPVCTGYSLTVPSAKITIPAGDYLTATRHDGTVTGWREEGVKEDSFSSGEIRCLFSYKE